MVKNSPDNAVDTSSISGSGRLPGGGHGKPHSILAWKIPGTEMPDGLQSIALQSQTQLSTHTPIYSSTQRCMKVFASSLLF